MPINRKLQNIIGTEHITDAAETSIAAQASGGATVAFKNVAVSGQDNIVADLGADTLNIAAGSNITLTTNAGTDTLTIAAAGGSPGGSDTHMQYNNGGSFGGISSFAYTDTADSEKFVISASSDQDLVRITQTGTGNALVVEDSANVDSTRFAVSAAGRVGIMVDPDVAVALKVNGNVATVGGQITATRFLGNSGGTASGPRFTYDGDTNTGLFFPAADNAAITTAGSERIRVGSSGEIGIGGANYGTAGQVLTSGGSGAAVSWAAAGGGSNDFDLQMIKSGVISGNQRHMLNKLPGWGSTGNSWQSRTNQDDPLFRPFIAPHTGNISEIGINCSTADGTGNTKITVAIYSDNEGVPYQKLGSIDIPCTSTGSQYVTSGFGTISLTRGTQYWWGYCRNNTTNTVGVRSLGQGDHLWLGPWNNISHVENYQVSLRLNSSANTMPSTITPSNLQGYFNNTLMCGIKIG